MKVGVGDTPQGAEKEGLEREKLQSAEVVNPHRLSFVYLMVHARPVLTNFWTEINDFLTLTSHCLRADAIQDYLLRGRRNRTRSGKSLARARL